MNKVFCPECRAEVTYKITERPSVQQLKGKEYNFTEVAAFCGSCGSELFIDSLSEENLKRLYAEYRESNSLISVERDT